MDRRGASLAPRSKRVLAQGRHIASHLGATLYAVAAEAEDDNDSWIAEAGLAGADKIVLLSFSGAGTHSPMPSPERLHSGLRAVCDALSPNLVLLDRNARGAALARGLSEHLGTSAMFGALAHFVDEDVMLEEQSPTRDTVRCTSLGREPAPLVATLSTALAPAAKGRDDADVIFFKAPTSPEPLPSALSDAGLSQELTGHIALYAGLECAPALATFEKLAAAIRAPLFHSAALARHLGASATENTLGAIAEPTIFLACGTGSDASHLSALDLTTTLIAFEEHPRNPSLHAANFGVLGPLSETVPKLLDAVFSAETFGTPRPELKNTKPIGVLPTHGTVPASRAVEIFSDPGSLLRHLWLERIWTQA